ncbi:MAG: helix-turn-helix transcriptional regulator, partial [Candidatus Udaeobacter sp.]
IYLREKRLGYGLSLRELERQTGISDSEIHKLEVGNQECRLSSFIRICSGLGIPPGLALDQVILSSYSFFIPRIRSDPGFKHLCRKRWKHYPGRWKGLAVQLGMFCSTAAHLLRCADATGRAQSFLYPTNAVRKAFTQFAASVDQTNSGLERANTLNALKRQPTAELKTRGLLELRFLDRLAWGADDALWWPIFDSAWRFYELDEAGLKK